jgi:selenocysteine-specific elongation factor
VTEQAPLTLGTAGHIDHGKTALVRALTGVDTDRLAQERQRGISIELGYALLKLPSGRRLSVIDVPGHERFVRTMVSGATGIDVYLMTIAADDGIMPQTREHAAVLAGLDVRLGVVAVTKADAADPGRALAQARELLPGAEAVAVSARTGRGLDELRSALDRLVAPLPGRAVSGGAARLHIDRVFTITGAGTVVTGTLWSGAVARGDELIILPSGRRARVRGVQVHDRPVAGADAGQRVAVNLTGVAVRDVARGDVLAGADSGLRPSHAVDVALDLSDRARGPQHGERVQVHHGTREATTRAAWLGGRFWQLRLERPVLALAGDRLIVRRLAPPDTLGGGVVLDAQARKHGPGSDVTVRLSRLWRGEPAEPPRALGRARGGARRERAGAAGSGGEAAAEPTELAPAALALEQRLREAWFEPPLESTLSAAEAPELASLRAAGRAVRVGRTLHYHPAALAEVERRVAGLIEREGQVTLARLRDDLGTSRKFAQALLEHFDAVRLTRRLPGDERVLRRR